MKKNFVIYTALFGDYDNLTDPPEFFEDCDFICFTDQSKLKSEIWKIVLVETCDLPPVLMNRMYKILPHRFLEGYDYSLYIDSNIEIIADPRPLFQVLKSHDSDVVIPSHFARKCLFDEAFVLLRSGRVEVLKVFQYTYSLMLSGFFCQVDMGENNIIFRRHNALRDFSEYWWSVFLHGVHRDQLSLSYVLWKTDTRVSILDRISSRKSVYFSIKEHKCVARFSNIYRIYLFVFFAIPYRIFTKLAMFFFKIGRIKLGFMSIFKG